MNIGIVANEFFDDAVGPMGGYGWLARETGVLLRNRGHRPVFLSGEIRKQAEPAHTESAGIPLLFSHVDWPQYVNAVRAYDLELLITIDYRPNYDFPLYALPDLPAIFWIQDPRPAEDIQKVNTLRIPGATGAAQGISGIDCTPMREVVKESHARGRPMAFASPAPVLTAAKAPATFGVEPRDSVFLPYIVDIPGAVSAKSPTPRVVFLGRLDPIKRPWVFTETARQMPEIEFLVLGQSHFQGPGSWQPADVPPNVRFLGHVTGPAKDDAVSSAWLLVNTSIHEALPVSFIEALLRETPIVSTQDPEGIVTRFGAYVGRFDGDGLEAVPSFVDAIRRLVSDNRLRLRLGRAGREWARNTHGDVNFIPALDRILARFKGANVTATTSMPEPHGQPAWLYARARAVRELQDVIPPSSSLILADEGTWSLEKLESRYDVLPLIERDGRYWGPPADEQSAIAEVERLRERGAQFAAFAWPSFWLLEHFRGFAAHLSRNYSRSFESDRLIIYDLRGREASDASH